MATLEGILQVANEAGASDIHLTVGVPPKMRVNGSLVDMGYPALEPDDTLAISIHIMNQTQRDIFEEKGEYDMSLTIGGFGRYRVNVFKQRGSIALALRLVATEIPHHETLGIPDSVVNLYTRKRGLILVTG
ncbi:MAG: type IV pili twitching motility protein PilT, partial [Lachnospiraceae bacterium]|nr:type IV pili twitching motility protein PilT [Lachnospiraceae bacterium]